jgi:hypothetical protein
MKIEYQYSLHWLLLVTMFIALLIDHKIEGIILFGLMGLNALLDFKVRF